MKRDLIMEELVIKEATNLKKHATSAELNKLNFDELNGNNKFRCVYGLMTGNCLSERSLELIRKCATKVYKTDPTNMSIFNNTLNGNPKSIEGVTNRNRLYNYTSPIENLLNKYKPSQHIKSKKILKLVKFLKDETKELVF